MHSPSLENYPESDKEVVLLANELWGEILETTVILKKIGQGQLFYGQSLEKVFETLNKEPDVIFQDTTIKWTHRKSEGVDIYFISNQEEKAKTIDLSFRISGRIPEIWDPATGKIYKQALFEQEYERTLVPIKFDPFESKFVIFRHGVPGLSIKTIKNNSHKLSTESTSSQIPVLSYDNNDNLNLNASQAGNYTLLFNNGERKEINVNGIPAPVYVDGSWEIHFPEHWDVPVDTTLEQLISWPDHQHEGIQHFSGKASYSKTINIPEEMIQPDLRLILDLGEVMVIAEVIINGIHLGTLWKKPFDIDITEAARKGENELEIRVTNTWWNRLVGDAKYPEGFPESKLKEARTYTTNTAWNADDELLKSGLLGPVIINIEKKYIIMVGS